MDLHIEAHRDNGSLVLHVSDTGTGLRDSQPMDVFGRGVGLLNIRDRLVHLYGEQQEFGIANRATGGAEVVVRVPYHTATAQPSTTK